MFLGLQDRHFFFERNKQIPKQPRQLLYKKAVLRNFRKIYGKTPVLKSLFIITIIRIRIIIIKNKLKCIICTSSVDATI